MATAIVPSPLTFSPNRRDENEKKLQRLLEAYVRASNECAKRGEPSVQWTEAACETQSSDTWVAETLTDALAKYQVAEEKRKNEVRALETFLAISQRRIAELTRTLGKEGMTSIEGVNQWIDEVVREQTAQSIEVEKLKDKVTDLQKRLAPDGKLVEPPELPGKPEEQLMKKLDQLIGLLAEKKEAANGAAAAPPAGIA